MVKNIFVILLSTLPFSDIFAQPAHAIIDVKQRVVNAGEFVVVRVTNNSEHVPLKVVDGEQLLCAHPLLFDGRSEWDMRKTFKRKDGTEETIDGTPEEIAAYEKAVEENKKSETTIEPEVVVEENKQGWF